MLKEMEKAAKEWGVGGRVAWIALPLTYLLLLRASELFAEDDGSVHAVYVLIGGDMAFYEGERQVEEGSSHYTQGGLGAQPGKRLWERARG